MENLTVERDGPVLRVWLDRPEKRNPLGGPALQELIDVFTDVNDDFAVRCVVLGGRGPSFSGGADRKAAPAPRSSDPTLRERRWVAQLGRRAVQAVEGCEVPTVARLHGHVVGGAAVLALACDFRIGAEDTSVWIPEVDLGIPLTWGAVPLLIRECGMARAREAIVVCDRIPAADAERWGILHRVVPAASLDAEVDGLAARLAAKPEAAVAMTKSQLRAYGAAFRLADLTELDGDLLLGGSRSAEARRAFGGGER
ncbi:MAG TPA: enoyl-CoA hydratase/isomerase family protein [Acidimicrobiales bacterium]|nr:enoyl-CoA hydratase/isomerase family protein [Acidimicrobiales bacterium]